LNQKYHARIYVTLRPSVLDPAGTAVQSGLAHMGYTDVESVRIGKYIEVNLNAADETQAHSQLNLMCDQLLANPVIENYRVELGAGSGERLTPVGFPDHGSETRQQGAGS
jgi:phosphoribosylformylglycinamidine synthase subunit PurS